VGLGERLGRVPVLEMPPWDEEDLVLRGGEEDEYGRGVGGGGAGEEFAFGEAGEGAGEAPGGAGPGGGVADGVLSVVDVEDGEGHVGVEVVVWG